MRVSVITPSKNQGRYIAHCLRSVQEQTHRDVEHIVLDGISNDETAEVAARYPCTFLQGKDSGPAQAINRGLDMVTGDIVCWLNADDAFSSSTALERVVRTFAELPEVDVITGNGYYIDENGKYIQPIIFPRPDRLCLQWIERDCTFLQPATFWRRNQFRLDENLKYCFDWKLWIDFFQASLNVLYVPEYFSLYRLQPSSLTYQDKASRRQEVYRIVQQYNRSRAQAAWCWAVWRSFQLSESLHAPRLKRFAVLVNAAIGILSDDRIKSI